MKNVLVVVATDQEYLQACKHTKHKVIQMGVASSNVIETLKDIDKTTKIINVGFAGSNNLPIGTIVKVKNSYLYHPNSQFDEKVYNLGGEVDCYTSHDFVLQTNIKEPVLFDMELNTICAFGFEVESYKIVSDNLSLSQFEKAESQQVDLTKCFKKVFEMIEEQKWKNKIIQKSMNKL